MRILRNEQLDVLRQKNKLSKLDQLKYFNEIVLPDLKLKEPKNILFIILKNKHFIGYCGLTNIKWQLGAAEISFLVKKKYNKPNE